MNTLLTKISHNLFEQLKMLIEQLTDESYSQPLPLLSDNTIAKHVRHIIELFEELVNGVGRGVISYDARKRNLLLEQERLYTMEYINQLALRLHLLEKDKVVEVVALFDNEEVNLNTTVNRELAYNIEHAIHHMAILQIVVKHQFTNIELPPQFGIAYSTQAYLKNNVHA